MRKATNNIKALNITKQQPSTVFSLSGRNKNRPASDKLQKTLTTEVLTPRLSHLVNTVLTAEFFFELSDKTVITTHAKF